MTLQFDYTKSPVSVAGLKSEIEASNITIALDYITILGESLSVFFKSDLSGGEETTLNGLVSAHDGTDPTPIPDPMKVTLYNSDFTTPVPLDSDNSPILRSKTTKTGWHYEPRSLDFYTSKYQSLYNRKHDGNGIGDGTDYGDAYLEFYNSSGTKLEFQVGPGNGSENETQFQTRLSTNCVKTCMNWQPTYDMDIIGGILMIKNAPTTDAYLWTVAAPQLSEIYGGQVPFAAGGWNLSFFDMKDKLVVNGRGAKTIYYDPVYNSNEFGIIVKHSSGIQIGIQMFYEHFKA